MEMGRDEGRESERERCAAVGDDELKLSRLWDEAEGGVMGELLDLSGVDECFGEEGASAAGVLDLGEPPHCDMNDRTGKQGISVVIQRTGNWQRGVGYRVDEAFLQLARKACLDRRGGE